MSNGLANFERKRLRRHLRENTHWKNQSEFFLAILFECGPPPHPITRTYTSAYSVGRLTDLGGKWADMAQWYASTRKMLVKRLPLYFSTTVIAEAYLKWLLREQEQGRIRTSGL